MSDSCSDLSEASSAPRLTKDTAAQVSSAAANKFAEKHGDFLVWAKLVHLNPNPLGEEHLPTLLREQVDNSRIVPPWIFNPEASQFKSTWRFFATKLKVLTDFGPRTLKQWCSPDQELSDDLESALLDILQVSSQQYKFTLFKTSPTKADCRRPLDQLNSCVWQIQGGSSFLHKLECHIQVPRPVNYSFHTTRPDSAVFLQMPQNSEYSELSGRFLRAICSIPREDTYTSVLHWVNEFRREEGEGISKRRVWMGMVSALYQRRALDFKDHYVYGAAHHSGSLLTIFAGAWTDQDAQGESLSRDATIILYELGTFELTSTPQMVRLYLLMRLSRRLAEEYKNAIEERKPLHVYESQQSGNDLDSWPPEPSSRSHRDESKPSFGTHKRTKTTSTQPLKRRFVDMLNQQEERARVQEYLTTSLHEAYDYKVEGVGNQAEGNGGSSQDNLMRDA